MITKNEVQDFISQIPFRHFVAIVLLVLAACANPVAPTGGPRDTEPPVILRSEPENGSVFFDAHEIRLTFDEFVQVRGLSQQFLSSPPFKKVPETRLRGKTLTIRLEEELRENTTYTLFFGNAISDFNEGNAIPNFRFIFSTGAVLDSMELKGRVVNAKTLAPEKDVFVMLYDEYHDSIPLQERPYYISRTNDKGDFTFTNLRNIQYKIFALRDVNANLIYDQPNEEIAFLADKVYPVAPPKPRRAVKESDTLALEEGFIPELDSLLSEHEQIPQNDSIVPVEFDQEIEFVEPEEIDELEPEFPDDGTELINDSIQMVRDSIELEKKHQALTLFLFNEVDSTQRLIRSEYLHTNRLQFVFRMPVRDLRINPLPPIEGEWKMQELSSKADTLVYWLKDIDRDSLVLEISASKMKTDTVRLSLSRMHEYRKDKLTDTIVKWLEVKTNFPRSGPFDTHQPIRLSFSEPLDFIHAGRIELMEDSTIIEPEVRFLDDLQRVLLIEYPWKDTTQYHLLIPDSTFFGIYGHYNDTIKQRFKTRMAGDYSNLSISIEHSFEQGQLIVELIDDKNAVVRQEITGLEPERIAFRNLLPGKFRVRLVHDANSNGKWDTGVYLQGIQPERVYIFDKELELRPNWDLDETFTVPE